MEIKLKNIPKNIGSIKIGDEEYDIILAKSKEEKAKGLQGYSSLPEDEGMLFINENPEDQWFHMKNVPFPLDLLGLDDDLKVIQIHHGKPNDETPMEFKGVSYVLEINSGSKVKEGDEAELEDSDTNFVMSVLAPNGEIQMKLEGGERIFSRKNTQVLIRKALKAYSSKDDKDYKALGKYIFKALKQQDNREPEYVSK